MKIEFNMPGDDFAQLVRLVEGVQKCSDEVLCNIFGVMKAKEKAEYHKEGSLDYHTKSYAQGIRVDLKAMRKSLEPAYLDYLQHMHDPRLDDDKEE